VDNDVDDDGRTIFGRYLVSLLTVFSAFSHTLTHRIPFALYPVHTISHGRYSFLLLLCFMIQTRGTSFCCSSPDKGSTVLV